MFACAAMPDLFPSYAFSSIRFRSFFLHHHQILGVFRFDIIRSEDNRLVILKALQSHAFSIVFRLTNIESNGLVLVLLTTDPMSLNRSLFDFNKVDEDDDFFSCCLNTLHLCNVPLFLASAPHKAQVRNQIFILFHLPNHILIGNHFESKTITLFGLHLKFDTEFLLNLCAQFIHFPFSKILIHSVWFFYLNSSAILPMKFHKIRSQFNCSSFAHCPRSSFFNSYFRCIDRYFHILGTVRRLISTETSFQPNFRVRRFEVAIFFSSLSFPSLFLFSSSFLLPVSTCSL